MTNVSPAIQSPGLRQAVIKLSLNRPSRSLSRSGVPASIRLLQQRRLASWRAGQPPHICRDGTQIAFLTSDSARIQQRANGYSAVSGRCGVALSQPKTIPLVGSASPNTASDSLRVDIILI